MKQENCIFCEITSGDIPSATIYEDEDFRVFLDLGPATKGHALLVPKCHYATIYQMPEELLAKVMVVAKKVIAALTPILKCDGYNVVQNNKEAAGQTVAHFHVHLIPRYCGDEAGFGWHMGELSKKDRNEILEAVKTISW